MRPAPQPAYRSHFYPRPPRGGRPSRSGRRRRRNAFLSTPSARRATRPLRWSKSTSTNFYPRPPRGGRPIVGSETDYSAQFLSTPSARRATLVWCLSSISSSLFLSTPSARRATHFGFLLFFFFGISIHALREEGDPAESGTYLKSMLFLSTPSARRATSKNRDKISIFKQIIQHSARI